MAEFFREPNRERLREILQSYDGENNNLDFKQQWIDQAKLAKHVLAFANSGGGVIVFGVAETDDNTLSIEGLDELMDKSDLAIDQYLPDSAIGIYKIQDFNYEAAEWDEIEQSLFQVLFIDYVPEFLPLVSTKRAEGRIDDNTIYVRKNTKSTKASQSDIQDLINERVEAQFENESRDLRKDLNQLKVLYTNMPDRETQMLIHQEENNLNRGILDQLLPGQQRVFYSTVEELVDEKEEQIRNRLGIQ